MSSPHVPPRRQFLRFGGASLAAAAIGQSIVYGELTGKASRWFTESGSFAEELLTPAQVEGPFYPDQLPLDTDNDLLVINQNITPAVGDITHLSGRVMDQKGRPIRNAAVEIWQSDVSGVYIHSRGGPRAKRDRNFQGFGRFTTDRKGRYYFRTIKPVAYADRAPHIHVAVYVAGQHLLTTQLYINGHHLNSRDQVFNVVRDPFLRELLLVDFKPVPQSKLNEQSASFDIVIGVTPDESETSAPKSGRRT